jgi:hypothetical protein
MFGPRPQNRISEWEPDLTIVLSLQTNFNAKPIENVLARHYILND